MTTHSKDSCPCGSGKRYKHCHQPLDAARRRKQLLFGALVVALAIAGTVFGPRLLAKVRSGLAGGRSTAAADSAARRELEAAPGAAGVVGTPAAPGAAATGVVNPNGVAGPPLRDPDALTLRPPNSGAVAPGENPKPWEYDIARNRYYDPRPGHMHWHSGAPPADPNAPVPAPQVIVTTADGSPVQVTTTSAPAAPGAAPSPGLPKPSGK
ncbi:MAG: SEC-C metal-binding domain-containing protein [Candidatus Eisenbacteria bacterium]